MRHITAASDDDMKNNAEFESILISEHRTAAITYEYEILKTDAGVRISYYCGAWNFREDTDREDCLEQRIEGGSKLCERITKLEETCRLRKWNGFAKAPRNVLDGGGFRFTAITSDGEKLSGHGENAYPKGYREFMTALKEILSGKI